ncbi:hypothetical protein AeMF1_008550 [Aphanomyces euteiches]|nr:hypothetical protein AeMF1_008550 [Aphanomyces euteiches]KAH9196662.1 hypothetical protein AeNC1_001343 [Aphanomyces euteiches]
MNIPLPLHATEGNGAQVWLSEADFDMYSINRGKKATALVATPLLESKKRKADEMTSTIPAAVDAAASCWEDVLHAKKTTLMPEDHKVYLELKQRKLAAQKSGLPEILALSESERETYTRIDALVVAERRNFRKQFERLAKKELVVLTTLPAAIEKKVDEELRLRCEHVKNLYPQLYTPISQLDLSAKVLEIAAPKHKLQGLVKKTPLTIREMPSVELPESTCRWPIGSVVSGDGTMRSLMAKHKCSIAMAASTLGALFDNHDGRFRKLWTIPVTVTAVESRREVYLDKPLVNAKWSSREKLTMYCRHLLKQYLKVPDVKTQSYHVWDFSGIPVLLRASSYTNAETKQPVTIHAKVDYEWSNLPEQITESERSAMWLHSWIRGNADIVYGLFHANGHRMLDLKQETIASIVSTDENPLSKFQLVQQILQHVMDLPPGQYLLVHADGAVKIYGSETTMSSSEKSLDLHERLDRAGAWDRSNMAGVLPQWSPSLVQIPYTFLQPSYCASYFHGNGRCDRIAQHKRCGHVHIRQCKARFIYQATAGPTLKKEQPRRRPSFTYCKPFTWAKRCFKANCTLEHLTMEAMLHRYAHEIIYPRPSKGKTKANTSAAPPLPPPPSEVAGTTDGAPAAASETI